MTDDRILLSHSRDLKEQSAENSVITNTAFLDLRQKALLKTIENENREYVSTFYYGGHSQAERTCAVFIPSFYQVQDAHVFFRKNEEYDPLILLRIDKDKFTSLSHRDYLGALMGLGIKREAVGDILVDESGCFIPCIKSVAGFICENMKTAGRATVSVSKVPFEMICERKETFQLLQASAASLRLDNIVAAAFSLSRANSVCAIEKGIVFVDDVQVMKCDARVSQNSKIVLRGKGKVVFERVDGKSKKGRLHITFRKYV